MSSMSVQLHSPACISLVGSLPNHALLTGLETSMHTGRRGGPASCWGRGWREEMVKMQENVIVFLWPQWSLLFLVGRRINGSFGLSCAVVIGERLSDERILVTTLTKLLWHSRFTLFYNRKTIAKQFPKQLFLIIHPSPLSHSSLLSVYLPSCRC